MKILIDIGHPAQWNFFKYIVQELYRNHKDDVVISVLRRGKLPEIVSKEFDGDIFFSGRYGKSKLSILFQANGLKLLEQLYHTFNKNYDIAFSCGGFVTGFIFKYFLRKPNIQFDDDPERKLNVFLEKLTCTELIFPDIVPSKRKVRTMNALKEWAYLSPSYFSPNLDELKKYNTIPKKYIFIREVSNRSFNYHKQLSNSISRIAHEISTSVTVLLSLEDKNTIDQYPSNWIILKEPVSDIHSLIYYSKVLISSGDSMAREGAMLGVPSIYCGIRKMAANEFIQRKGLFYHEKLTDVATRINEIMNQEIVDQVLFRENLQDEWIDINMYMKNLLKKYRKD